MHIIQKDYFNCQSTYLDLSSEANHPNSKVEFYNMQQENFKLGTKNPLDVRAAELFRSEETKYHNFSNQVFDFNQKVLHTQYHPMDGNTVVGSN